MTQTLTKTEIKNIATLLNRVNLTGAEAPVLVALLQKLEIAFSEAPEDSNDSSE